MTLLEMSAHYAEQAASVRARIVELRHRERLEQDPAAAGELRRRIAALMPLYQEARALAKRTARYYDRRDRT